jgi:DNA topoisomerase-3
LAKDAIGSETKVKVELGGEMFHADGESCEQKNWLEIFHWFKWSDKVLPNFYEG